jgi:hypothetical protein
MAGLNLVRALDQYQQGVAWKQNQEQVAKAKAHQAAMMEADKAATGVIDQSKAQWAMNGAQGEYRPNSETVFRAIEARGSTLAKAGMWDQFMENEARAAPMRMKARGEALQQYQVDGDVDRLARAVYPTLFDGKTIVGSEQIEGADAVAGLPARAAGLKVKLSDGTERVLDPQKLVGQIKLSLDPDAVKREAIMNVELAKIRAQGEERVRAAEATGEQARKTEGVKAENARGLASVKFGYDSQLQGQRDTAADKRNERTVQGGLQAAGIRAEGGVRAAGVRASGDGKGAGGKKDQVFDQIHDELIRGYGKENPTSLSGSKTGDELTLRAARYAQDLVDKENIPMRDALVKAGAELKKRRAAAEAAGN